MIPEPARQFEKGTLVSARDNRELGKKWIPGTIAAKTGPLSYEVEIATRTTWRRHTDQQRSVVFEASPLSSPVLVRDKNLAFLSTV